VIRWLARWAVRLVAAFVVTSVGAVLAYRYLNPPLTPLMAIRAVGAVADQRPVRITKEWVALEAISPALVRAVIAAEDARFLAHGGVDLDAVRRARAYNARHPTRRPRGASTITMQCARNLFLWPGRTYVRKALEAYFAVLMEHLWGKRRILEVYLNVIEWGDGVYGAEAAARRYFGVPAVALRPAEAALLAAALPAPRRFNPAEPTAYLRARAAVVATRTATVHLDRVR
jgi:monofunctional biosynthetic peptidoglycan transglycosylase